MFTINCKGKLLLLDKPVVMGILNITPDSFYQGHLKEGTDVIVKTAGQMIQDGAAIIDIGGQSTRPGSERINADEEIKRVLPIVTAVHHQYPDVIISVDTYYSEVVTATVAAGASMINDISAGNMDDKMIQTVAALKVPYVCMHMQGNPDTMQKDPQYDDVVKTVLDFFINKIDLCKKAGIIDIIIDPGFGFGKTIEHNFQLLKNLHSFSMLQKPILAGISRKSTIYKTLNTTAEKALNGTTSLNTIALMNGASILRVHDVKQAKEAVQLFNAYQQA